MRGAACASAGRYAALSHSDSLNFYSRVNQGQFTDHYSRRSNVETTFRQIKSKFGECLRSEGRTAQINEVLCKVLCHNICCLIQSIYELGVEPTFWTEP